MAEQVQERGGVIGTSCKVNKEEEREDGALNVSVTFDESKYKVIAKNVVHAWNGYGDREQFLPERLYSNFEGQRSEVVALRNSGVDLTEAVGWYHPDYEEEEFGINLRSDDTIIVGGYCGNDGNITDLDDTTTDDFQTECLMNQLTWLYPDRTQE